LSRDEQKEVLGEIFDENVRQKEIQELSRHFSAVMRNGECIPVLGVYGSTGTGKSVTISYFLQLFTGLCRERDIPFRVLNLDIATPRPCFRALNDLACLLGVSKRYQRGISLDEFMGRIEEGLKAYHGYLTIFVDEIDNIRRDLDFIQRGHPGIPVSIDRVFVAESLNTSRLVLYG